MKIRKLNWENVFYWIIVPLVLWGIAFLIVNLIHKAHFSG